MIPQRPSRRPIRRPGSTSLRPMGLPRPLEVRADEDAMPLAVARIGARISSRGGSGGEVAVVSIEEVWRIAEAWWREASQARTYYRVILEGGRRLTLFRDDATGTWFEQPYSPPGQEPEPPPSRRAAKGARG